MTRLDDVQAAHELLRSALAHERDGQHAKAERLRVRAAIRLEPAIPGLLANTRALEAIRDLPHHADLMTNPMARAMYEIAVRALPDFEAGRDEPPTSKFL